MTFKKLAAAGLALALLTGTASAAAVPAVLPENIRGGAPSGIAAEGEGFLFTDVFHKIVWRSDRVGEITHRAGQIGVAGLDGEPLGRYEDGTRMTAFFMEPWDIAPYQEGYAITDAGANVVRYLNEEGVHTLAGSGKSGQKDDYGKRAEFSRPTGLAADGEGNLYVADTDLGLIRKIDQDRKVTTICSGLTEPTGLCWAEGKLYVAETGAHRVGVVNHGRLEVLTGGTMGDTDGPADKAALSSPQDVALDGEGALYIADTGNGAVKRLRDGRVTTLLDMGELGFAPVLPRSLLVTGDTLLVTDPFAPAVLEIELWEKSFRDVPETAWYHDAVLEACDRGLAQGVGEDRFDPEGTVTRAMFVRMLANLQSRLDGGVVIDGAAEFPDVEPELWYSAAVRWAGDQGITRGDDSGRFQPDGLLTRQQLATFLWNYAKMAGAKTSARGDLSAFADGEQVAEYARLPVTWAVEQGLLKGSDGSLQPAASATRAQAMTLLVRFMDWLQA